MTGINVARCHRQTHRIATSDVVPPNVTNENTSPFRDEAHADAAALFAGSGEVRALARELDWSASALGPTTAWTPVVRTTVRMIFESPFPMCLWIGPQLCLVYNDPYCRIIGIKHPASLGQPGSIAWAEAWDQLQPQFETVWVGGGPLHFEDAQFELTRSDSNGTETAWFEYGLSALREADGTVVAVLNISPETTGRFVTQRRLTQEQIALAVSEDRLRLAVESADVAFWDVDLVNDAVIWPWRTRAMFGISADVPVTLDDFYSGLHPDDLEATRAAFLAAADPNQRRLYDVEYRTIGMEDGLERWVAAKGRGVFDDAGRCVRVTGVVVEITARRRAEEALRELNTTLEARVTQALEERENAQEALRQSQKMEAIGQLTGGVAHDFNNLLTVIRGSVDLLRRENVAPEKRQRYLDAIGDTADRAAKLTGQLLAFARRQTLEPQVFEIAHRFDAIADMLDSITGTLVVVRFEVPETSCRIHADVSQFETALVNLIVNARDAMNGEGTITIRLRCNAHKPAIRGHEAGIGEFVAVSLTDTGVGIAADDMKHIFEPFFTTKEVGKGTGLGLSQVFGFAKQSGGDVDVESVVGQGSTFTLYLPQSDAAGTEDARPATQEETVGGEGRSVLVVEDNISVGQFATQLLDDLGYHTTWVTSAEDALERLGPDGDGFDIVFSDVVMPGMGGVELARRLANDLPVLPVVLASGYSNTLAQEGVEGIELLRKPYSATQLSAALQRRIAWAAAMQG